MSALKSIAFTAGLLIGCSAMMPTASAGGPVPRRRAVNNSQLASSERAASARAGSVRAKSERGRSQRAIGSSRAKGKSTIERAFLPRWKILPKVTRRRPGLLFVLVDGSGSMREEFAPGVRKADSVAEVTNNVLGSLVERFRSGSQVSDRLDVVALRYGDKRVTNAFEGSLAGGAEPIEISRLDTALVNTVDLQDEEGNTFTAKAWLAPGAPGGDTPMSQGFGEALQAVRSWKRRPVDTEHLVLGVHVSDGIFTDGDPTGKLAELQDVAKKQGGKLVMTNILLAKHGATARPVLFPTPADAEGFDEAGKLLFKLSSPVPEALARSLGKDVIRPGARMMAYNADPEGLEQVFVAGSSSAIE